MYILLETKVIIYIENFQKSAKQLLQLNKWILARAQDARVIRVYKNKLYFYIWAANNWN